MTVISSENTYTAGVLVERKCLNDDGTVDTFNGAGILTGTVAATSTSLASVAASITGTDDDRADSFIRARFPTVLAKAKAIMADPAGAPAFTAAEAKVIQAVMVLDVASRFR